jgi:hypothetical protein
MNHETAPARPNTAFVKLFGTYSRAYFRRHFTALRVSAALPVPDLGPHTILYSNHPSWWDPIVLLIFAAGPLSKFSVYAPIESKSLARYPILGRLGLFGIDTGSVTGTRRFVAASSAILNRPENMLVTTAQGRFADIRERPAGLRNGVAHLLQADPRRVAVPVALEYMHWSGRLPEALVAFGAPQHGSATDSISATTGRLEAALVATLDALARESVQRDPKRFYSLVGGRETDVGGVYGTYRAARQAFGRLLSRRSRSHRAVSGPKA